ncbi:hypothetical protein JX265_003087 [Neoarthrinium moseri]|uniref:DUF7918 domain-containing protein n=1 Tax=Neoarthrinium moseri TaxID=1658444 RepID=A0A9P9WTK4_9PEZI|nr:hypothetical protein JX265_003087 [Neoarthrinium moseri]
MIYEDIPGIEVAVQIGGEDAAEYDAPDAGDEDAARASLTKYVECIDNAQFSVRVKVNGDYDWRYKNHDLCFRLYVDGHFVSGRIFDHDYPRTDTIRGYHTENRETGQWYLHKLQFAPVTTVDDAKRERVEKDAKIAKDLGVITVKVYRGTTGARIAGSSADPKKRQLELAEKSLKGKAVSHGATYGPKEIGQQQTYSNFIYLPGEGQSSIANFNFLYRSREALKRELIIPRSPSPSLATMSAAERDRLAMKRLEQLKEKKVKNERGRRVKREFGEMFDLTEDGDDAPRHRPGKMTRMSSGRVVEVIDLDD